ncbi:MAG: hypothetical protein K5852_08030 [Eubacterium sp.]|nr:hypothetical protein [Eubacterium sp.]
MGKLTFNKQCIIAGILYLILLVCGIRFSMPRLIDIGWVCVGALFLINPAVPDKYREKKNAVLVVRIIAVAVIAAGVFLR